MAIDRDPPASRGRVLVADDDLSVRDFLTDFLEQHNFTVHAVSDGRAALAAWRTEPFDLIFVDLQMPGLTGLEVATEVRKTNASVPIALITGTFNALDANAVQRAGITRMFAKPFDLAELTAWIDSLPF